MTHVHEAATPSVPTEASNSVLPLLATMLLAWLSTVSATEDTSASELLLSFDIPEQPVPEALGNFARQASLQLLFISDGFEQVKANRVVGLYAPQDALDQLLAGTGLLATVSGNSGIKVRQMSAVPGLYFHPASTATAVANASTRKPSPEQSTPQTEPVREGQIRSEAAGRLIEEVVVTGTSIRGVVPESSPLEVYTAADIASTGVLTAEQFVATLPQNNNTLSEIGSGGSSRELNSHAISSVDLRGLGVGSTLVLLNGRRVAPSANGRAPDISFIPLRAVERIEVLTDGASAIYGADAIGGVINFILKRSYEGAESVLSYGGARGGGDTLRFDQSLGRSWTTGNALAVFSYFDRKLLDAESRSFSEAAAPLSLLPSDTRRNLLLTVGQTLPREATLNADLILAARKPHTVFLQTLQGRVLDNSIESDQITANVELAKGIGGHHEASLLLTYSDTRTDEDSLRIGLDGAKIGSTYRLEKTSTSDFTLKFDGTLLRMGGEELLYAAGAGWSRDEYGRIFDTTGIDGDVRESDFRRNTTYAFTEFHVPLISPAVDIPGTRRLELSLAARYTDYSDFGNRTSPKLGLLWEPVSSLRLRATIGDSYKAPFLHQLDKTVANYLLFRPSDLGYEDIWSPDGSTAMLFPRGFGNPTLGPEKARTSTIGFDLDLAHVNVSATYYSLKYRDRIDEPDPSGGFVVFENPRDYPELFNLDPSLEQVEAALSLDGINLTEIDGSDPMAVHNAIGAIFDNRIQNLSVTKLNALDLNLQYSTNTPMGKLSLGARASKVFRYDEKALPSLPAISRIDTVLFPADLKVRAHVGLQAERWNARLNVNYVDDYENPFDQMNPSIDAWTTLDLLLSTSVPSDVGGWLGGVRIALAFQNLLDENPPFVTVGTTTNTALLEPIGFDPANASPIGRFISLQVSKKWQGLGTNR